MDVSMFFRRNLIAVTLAGLTIVAFGSVTIARMELNRLRDAFETDARIVHRLLSHRAAQQDAVMAMLTLLHPADQAARPRIASVYPQVLAIQQRQDDAIWPDALQRDAEAESRRTHRAALASADFANGRFQILQAAVPTSYAVQIDLRGMVPWD